MLVPGHADPQEARQCVPRRGPHRGCDCSLSTWDDESSRAGDGPPSHHRWRPNAVRELNTSLSALANCELRCRDPAICGCAGRHCGSQVWRRCCHCCCQGRARVPNSVSSSGRASPPVCETTVRGREVFAHDGRNLRRAHTASPIASTAVTRSSSRPQRSSSATSTAVPSSRPTW